MAGALALGVLAACDPPAGSGTTTSSASPSGSASAAGQDKYQSCMAAAGWSSADISRLEGEIFQPSPSSTPDPSAEKFRGDLLRCQRDAGILPDDDNGGSVDPSAANVAIGSFVTCMRTRGWDLADPKPGPDGALVPPAPPENLGAQQEAFNTDQISCLSDSGLVQGGPTEGG